MLLALFIVGPFVLVALGIRSYARIAHRARVAGELDSGFADNLGNSSKVYAYAFRHFTLDTVLMLVGFAGGVAWGLAGAFLLH